MECKKEENQKGCTCTATNCSNRGVCCECVKYHRERKELPGCFFSPDAEKTWDRTIANFIKCQKL
jgi:hypothetical protein